MGCKLLVIYIYHNLIDIFTKLYVKREENDGE